MSLWLREEQKAQPPGGTSYGWGGGPAFSDAFRLRRAPSGPALAEAYKSVIYTCVRKNSEAVARVPLRLFRIGQSKGDVAKYGNARRATRGEKLRLKAMNHTAKAMAGAEEVEEITGDHLLLKVLDDVNPHMDHTMLLSYIVMSMDVVGTGFVWPTEYHLGAPREVWPLPPHLVYPTMSGSGLVPESYQFGSAQYRPEDLLIFKHLSMKNPYGLGMSPAQAAIEYARLEDTYVSIADEMISNGPRPSVVVSHKDPQGAFGSAERKRLEDDMNRKGRGGRAGGAFVVDGAVSVTPISYTPADLGSMEIAEQVIKCICGCFGVPVSMIKTDDVNKANAEAGLEQHARDAVEPRCKAIASVLTRWTHSLDRGGNRGWGKLFWAFDGCVPEDKQLEADLFTKYVAMGLPLNVALTEAGYDAVEGGDTSFVPSSLVTLENAIKPPEPPPGADPENPEGEEPAARDDTWDEAHPEAPAEAVDEAPAEDVEDEDEETKALDTEIHTKLATSLASIESKRATLGLDDDGWLDDLGIEYYWDPILKRATPCRDNRGRFASCGTGGGAAKPKPGDKKPAASGGPKPREAKPKKPKEAKPDKPAAAPKKPKEAEKPAEKPAKPESKPKPKPEKPAAEKPAKEKPVEKPQEKPKPAEAKPEPEDAKPSAQPSATGTNFGESKATIASDPSLTAAEAKAYQDKAKHIIGPGATDADIASIIGAPDNAKVTLADGALYGHEGAIVLQSKSDDMQSLRFIKRDKNGDLVIKNEFIMVEGKKGTGIGTKVFGRQVEQAVRLGATKITAEASRSMGMNGYITWPKLGYDAPIPASVMGGLPASLKGSKNISDLMKTSEGTEWWTKNGVTTDMTFDLKEGSHSRKHLAAYLERKGVTQ